MLLKIYKLNKAASDEGKKNNNEQIDAESNIKIKMMDDKVKNLVASLESLKQEVDTKADKNELFQVENVKVSKDELLSLLPNEESRDMLKEEFRSEIAYFNRTIDELARAWDLKLVKLRKEMDLYTIQRDIHKRPTKEEIDEKIDNVNQKHTKLEGFVTKFTFEFDHIRDFVRHTGKIIKELQELNQGALLGKQNINCLSCGRGDHSYVPGMPKIKGKDGRIYKGGIAKGYTGLLDRSYQDQDTASHKFFLNRRDGSATSKQNQSHTQSKQQLR